jgi:hypothetical protein
LDWSQSVSFKCSECGAKLAFDHKGACPECGNPEPEPSVILIEEPQERTQGIAARRLRDTKGLNESRGQNQAPDRSQPRVSNANTLSQPDPIAVHKREEAQKVRANIYELRKRLDGYRNLSTIKEVFSSLTERLGCIFSFGTIIVFCLLLYATRDSDSGTSAVMGLFVVFVVIAVVVMPIVTVANVRKRARHKRDLEVELKVLETQLAQIEE